MAPSLEVFPLQGYGAIEVGQHTFCNMAETPVCKDETNGIGRFFMLWQKQGDQYRLTRVVSFDHFLCSACSSARLELWPARPIR